MIRYTALWLFVCSLLGYAWRDWCKSLCVLIMMLAVLERPDMPKGIFGIQGMNPFNVALAGILAAWFVNGLQEHNTWDVPKRTTIFFGLYILVMLMSTARMIVDPSYLLVTQSEIFQASSRKALIADYLINTFKWIAPAVLLVQGCRGEERQRWLIAGVAVVYTVLAILVIKQMPLGYLLDGEKLQQRAADVLQKRVGYHRVDLATMFAGGAWAILAARQMFASRLIRFGLLGMSGITTLGLALSGGRTGYATFCLVGLVMCFLKWRRYLLLAPVAVAAVLIFAPGITQRMLQGFTGTALSNEQLVTSGRNLVWPYALEKIGESPIVGYGRQAWVRTNTRYQVAIVTGESFGHPHNAYLEFTLDNGIFGLAVILPFFGMVLWNAAKMFRVRDNPIVSGAGGAALAATLGFVIAAMGAQTFYPTEGSVGMWCLIALATRVGRDAVPVTVASKAARPRLLTVRNRPAPAARPRALPRRPLRGPVAAGAKWRR